MPTKTIIISFDMEPDIGSWTSAVKGITQGTPEILKVLKGHRVPATFLFTGREALNHPRIVAQVLADGHEIGCHTMYHETVGIPVYDVPVGGFILDHEIERRLAMATEAVEQVAGVRPVSFRAPRLFGSAQMLQALERLGYQVDSSFPAYFYGKDFQPYHPSVNNWSRPGRMKIWELPVFYDKDAGRDDRAKNRNRDQWPMLRLKGAHRFGDLVRRMMMSGRLYSGSSVLCIYLHPWEFVRMPVSVRGDECQLTFRPFLHRHTGRFTLRALDEFLGTMSESGVNFMTLRQWATGNIRV